MYMYMYVYIYIYIVGVYIYIYIYLYTHYIYIYIYIYTHVFVATYLLHSTRLEACDSPDVFTRAVARSASLIPTQRFMYVAFGMQHFGML